MPARSGRHPVCLNHPEINYLYSSRNKNVALIKKQTIKFIHITLAILKILD